MQGSNLTLQRKTYTVVYSSTSNFQLLPVPPNPKCQMALMLWLPSFSPACWHQYFPGDGKHIYLAVGDIIKRPLPDDICGCPIDTLIYHWETKKQLVIPLISLPISYISYLLQWLICFGITNWLKLMTISVSEWPWLVWCSHLQTVPMLTWDSRTSTAASSFRTYDDQKDRTNVNQSWTGL